MNTATQIATMTGQEFFDYLDEISQARRGVDFDTFIREGSAERPAAAVSPYSCPACSHVEGNDERQDSNGVTTCGGCNALFGTRAIYAGESYGYVRPHFGADPEEGSARYFDFTVLNGEGVTRRHGWFNPSTKMITQTG